MDKSFWLDRWDTDRTGFHNPAVNALLERHHAAVLAGQARVLVPLCGKSLDLWWLRDQGHEVVGVELSEKAVLAFFQEAGVRPDRSPEGALTAWRTEGLTLYQGDFFAFTGRFDAVWDRAALVALPPPMRARYAQHLRALVEGPGLLVTFDYDQGAREGPPFAVPEDEVRRHYARVERLEQQDITAEMRGRGWTLDRVEEHAYRLELRR